MAHFRFGCALLVLLLACGTQARQLRINRYTAAEEEEETVGGVEATVREVQPAPYPAAGYRPGRAFSLPGEAEGDEEGSGLSTTTTEWPETLSTTTTTDSSVLQTTTVYNEVPAELNSDDAAKQGRALPQAPYPAAGYRPSKAFLLPNEITIEFSAGEKADSEVVDAAVTTTTASPAEAQLDVTTTTAAASSADASPTSLPKAPYPAAGYRPSKAFLLPNEVQAENRISVQAINEPEPEPPVSPADKAGHPACGVSDNPPAPKPEEGAADDPDAERVFVAVSAPVARFVTVRSQPLVAQPLYIAAARPFAYSASVQSW